MPLKKPSEFYIKNPSTSMDEVKEGLNIAAPEKIENLSEAFNNSKDTDKRKIELEKAYNILSKIK